MNGKTVPKLPENWVWATLGGCVDILDRKRVPINAKERDERKGNIPYYGATGQVGWIDEYLFDEELVLLGEDGAPFFDLTKNTAYIIRGKSWVNNHAHVLRAIFGVTLNQFLCNYLNNFNYQGYVTGTTRHKLNQSQMRIIPLPLPPLPEQRRIVTKVEELFTRLDAGVGALTNTKAQLKRYHQSVLKSACEGRLVPTEAELARAEGRDYEPADVLIERIKDERKKNEKRKCKDLSSLDILDLIALPEGWVWASLGDITTFKNGINFNSTQKGNTGMLTIDVLNMYSNSIHVNLENLYRVDIQLKDDYLLKYGDILFVRSSVRREGVGWATLFKEIKEPVTFCGFIIRARLQNKEISPEYLTYYSRTNSAREKIISSSSQVTITNINQKSLGKIPIPLPPLPEQHRIVAEIEHRLSVADEMGKTVDQSLKHAERLRQSILKRAFEGKLVPQDSNDEPASVLLKRIEEEKVRRDAEEKAKKKSKTKPKRKKMKVRMDAETEKQTVELYEILRLSKVPLTLEELWLSSKLEIEDFYDQLKIEVEKGRIIERRRSNSDIFMEIVI